MAEKRINPPIHPGALLREEFLEPRGITPEELAKEIGVAMSEISEIVEEQRGIRPDTALRLSHFFGLNDGYWMRVQSRYEKELEEYLRDREG
jgi:addiction module HigA family antidote